MKITNDQQEVIEIPTQIGLSIIPVSKVKIPFQKWDEYKNHLTPIDYWYNHYKTNGTVGIITGKVSGNLEVIDIDVKNDPNSTIAEEFAKLIPEKLKERLIAQTTPNNGFHLIYRCPEVTVGGNLILAKHSDGSVIIETRGEGGYFCTSKDNNKVRKGVFDLENFNIEIPVISEEERNLLFETARSLTRYFPLTDKKGIANGANYSEPAINRFNTEYNIIDLFVKHGWSVVKEEDEKIYLLRPGKSSALHSGYYFTNTKTFFCFSTSTAFKSEKPYNHFQILQVLENNSDYRTTLRRIADLGFSTDRSVKKDKITADDIAGYINSRGVRYDRFIQDITFDGNPIEELEMNTLYIDLKNEFDKEIPRTRFEEVIKSRYITTINPIEDFVAQHRHRQPSGMFERWVEGIELMDETIEKSVAVHFMKKWYVGLVAQTLDGPYPNEFFLTILSTEQGIGKTTFLRNYVLPPTLRKYVAECSLSFDDDFKVIMGQSILIVDDEMDGRTYDSAQTFKSILSKKVMPNRRKYDRRITNIKRRCSFAGSGNQLNVIREDQNRRIIPLEVKAFDRDKLNQIDFDDLFMEAYHLYEAGFQYSYTYSDQEMLVKLCENYVEKSDVQLLLEDYIIKSTSTSVVTNQFISTTNIVNLLSNEHRYHARRLNSASVGRTMRAMGHLPVRIGTQRISGFMIDKLSKIFNLDYDNDFLLGFPEKS